MKNLTDLRNARGDTEWFEMLFSNDIAWSFSVVPPFIDDSMPDVASDDFQRSAIYRLDVLEMCPRTCEVAFENQSNNNHRRGPGLEPAP